ncbi:MAG TPA: hypothetical protein VGW57_04795 [Chthoniobacterales bacterium]|nr:hypothetical protein [Chthoniobacterales bacterium]
MALDLYFPPLNGGVEQGLNHAGIETFEGNFERHIVRECTQNALDAPSSDEAQVRVEIRLRRIPAVQIPGLGALRAAIQSSREYWDGDEKTEAFCNKALSWTQDAEIAVLEISDYGTTGLVGADGDRHGTWFGLVQSGGVSIKAGDAGGAYGIGKDAPFAGSFIRTVFYSSVNHTGECAFQGVAKLMTHFDAAGRKTQPTGFIGIIGTADAECASIRHVADIPPPFRRDDTGTSLFVLAYRQLGGETWTREYIREAVENFWPAIHRGKLVFQIEDQRIDAATLPSLMSRFSGDPEFISRFYYRAVANASRLERQIELPNLGSCRLYLVPGDSTYPKKVCMTRQTGMVIYEAGRFRSYRPFAGLFVCESTEGNAYLRHLEPPRHHKWDPTRADNAVEARRVLKSIRDWINLSLRDLNPDEQANEADVPELNRYLPDEEDEPLFEESEIETEPGGDVGIVTAPVAQALMIQEVPPRPPVRKGSGPDAPRDGQEEGLGVGGGQINPGPDETETPGGLSETTGGGATGPSTPNATKTLLQTRAIKIASNSYELIIRSTASCSGKLVLVSVGEDNREDKDLSVNGVRDMAADAEVSLDQFALEPGQTARLRVEIESTVPLSLRAYCHGN